MNDLNKQYFKTREIHERNVRKGSWKLWIGILVLAVVFLGIEVNSQISGSLTEEQIIEAVENFDLALSDLTINSKKKDFSIKVKAGYYFGNVDKEMPHMALTVDSTESIVFVRKSSSKEQYESLIKQWEKQIIKTDSTYKFQNIETIRQTPIRVESANVQQKNNNKIFLGKILITQKGDDIYIVQGLVYEPYWNKKELEIIEILDSFETK